jgi:hypothetical protein
LIILSRLELIYKLALFGVLTPNKGGIAEAPMAVFMNRRFESRGDTTRTRLRPYWRGVSKMVAQRLQNSDLGQGKHKDC